jgi:hypothetical protein
MFRLQCRGSIAGAAVVVALLSSRPADAQVVGVDPGPPREHRTLCRDVITGAEYDVLNVAGAEHRLQNLQAKLRRDSELGDTAAVDHDLHRIDNVRYRIAIHEWLVRWNSREYPCFYPIRTDEVSCAAIAQAVHPTVVLNPQRPASTLGPMVFLSTISITIVNAEPAGDGIDFAIDGVAHQAAAGSSQDLDVASGSHITYDGGGSLGQRRYRILSPGRYEFRSTAKGWALYKLPSLP